MASTCSTPNSGMSTQWHDTIRRDHWVWVDTTVFRYCMTVLATGVFKCIKQAACKYSSTMTGPTLLLILVERSPPLRLRLLFHTVFMGYWPHATSRSLLLFYVSSLWACFQSLVSHKLLLSLKQAVMCCVILDYHHPQVWGTRSLGYHTSWCETVWFDFQC